MERHLRPTSPLLRFSDISLSFHALFWQKRREIKFQMFHWNSQRSCFTLIRSLSKVAKTRIKIMFQFSKLMDPSSYLCPPCTLSKVPCAIHSTLQVNMHHLHVHPWVILSTSHPCLQTFPEVRGFAWIWRTFSRSASQVAANLYHLTFHAW